MIEKIDIQNPVLLDKVLSLQKASYQIEAEIINYYEIPPLLETREELRDCGESFFGYFIDGNLAGFLSYTIENHLLDICRVAVHPDYFRRGIADALLEQVLALPGLQKAIVSTGKKNLPALRLYQKHGFIIVGDKEIAKGIYLTDLEKLMNN
jgi:ribosomal protein S18 acetylase RimI-like enzyme